MQDNFSSMRLSLSCVDFRVDPSEVLNCVMGDTCEVHRILSPVRRGAAVACETKTIHMTSFHQMGGKTNVFLGGAIASKAKKVDASRVQGDLEVAVVESLLRVLRWLGSLITDSLSRGFVFKFTIAMSFETFTLLNLESHVDVMWVHDVCVKCVCQVCLCVDGWM